MTTNNHCSEHPGYTGQETPISNCSRCWTIRKRVVGCIRADIELDAFLASQGLARTYNTVVSVPWGGRKHVM
jgi:hypothetical protein